MLFYPLLYQQQNMGNTFCLHQQSKNKQPQLTPQSSTQSKPIKQQTNLSFDQPIEQCETPLKLFVAQQHKQKSICGSNNLVFNCKAPPAGDKARASEEIIMTKPKMKAIKQQNQNKRCSIDKGNFYQFQSTIKDYVVTEKTMHQQFGRIQIHQEKFITLRTQNIKDYYRFQQIIGEGSYGSVYRAICVESGEERAVKIIKKSGLAQSKKNEVFAQLQLLKKMDHPNIIKLYQVFESKERYQVVTQYCKGGSIIDFIKERQYFDQSTVKIILKQLLGCLNYLHTLKIVHRDIKLQNIVFISKPLNSTTKQIQIKLIDFGTAFKMMRPKVRCNDLIGTISYIAPQIVKGYFTDKCDLWSCGVILHILLTSKSPFKCKRREDTLQKIVHHHIDYSNPVWNDISEDAKDLVKKLLQKDPYRRLSADHALKHRWFQANKEKGLAKDSQFVKSLTNYYRQNNLISVLESYLIFSKVSQEQRNRINLLFKQLDENSDGVIEKNELIHAYRQANSGQANLDQVQYILNKIDKDNSGCINLHQFSSVMINREKLFVKDALSSAFDYFAKGTGFIEMKQLSELLQGSDSKQVQALLGELDENRDKKISKTEFLNYLMKKGCLY